MKTEEMNRRIQRDLLQALQMDTQRYEEQVLKTANYIADHAEDCPVVFLSGPSGSGKTTTALLLERELDARGAETHTLSMDDYFKPLTEEERILVKQNKLDLETPARLDTPFMKEQLEKIIACEEVQLPRYDFIANDRVFEGKTLKRKPGEIVIVEGIHALNPEATGLSEHVTRLYVSVRTRMTSQKGTTLHPSQIRLARRMIRDLKGRGRSFEDTIRMREKVDRGEKLYIMPYKSNAHCSIDSFFGCELSVYKPLLMNDLDPLSLHYPELKELMEVLEELPEIPTEAVPSDSLIREFIGGSDLPY